MCPRALLVFVGLLGSACSLVELNETTGYQLNEKPFNPQLFNAISPEQTHKQWLLSHLGHPTQIIALGRNEVQYLYAVKKVDTQGKRVFLIYEKNTRAISSEVHVVQLKGDKVVDYWVNRPETLSVQEKANNPALPATDAKSAPITDTPKTTPPAVESPQTPGADSDADSSADKASVGTILPAV